MIKSSIFELLKELIMCEQYVTAGKISKQLADELNIIWTYLHVNMIKYITYETVKIYWQSKYIKVYHFMKLYKDIGKVNILKYITLWKYIKISAKWI